MKWLLIINYLLKGVRIVMLCVLQSALYKESEVSDGKTDNERVSELCATLHDHKACLDTPLYVRVHNLLRLSTRPVGRG